MKEYRNYNGFDREEWRSFYRKGVAPLTADELDQIKSFNDRIGLQDVQEIYTPLTHLIHVYMKEYESLQLSKSLFLKEYQGLSPFIIGVAGSVAVGKSTTARLLQIMLKRMLKGKKVQLITTDGFLHPNQELEKRGLLDRKGFPESYDMERLINCLEAVKNGKKVVEVPVYSHSVYDILPGEVETIEEPDVLIVEGINVLQSPSNQQIYISDFFDFSVFVDAQPELIETWYLDRFEALLDTAFQDPDNYYYDLATGKREDALLMARQVWKDVNLKNLTEYILPTRNRADLIIHKAAGHQIDAIYLRKY